MAIAVTLGETLFPLAFDRSTLSFAALTCADVTLTVFAMGPRSCSIGSTVSTLDLGVDLHHVRVVAGVLDLLNRCFQHRVEHRVE